MPLWAPLYKYTEEGIAEQRLAYGNSLLTIARTKRLDEDDDDISVTREIQAAKDIIRVEQKAYDDYKAGIIPPTVNPLIANPSIVKYGRQVKPILGFTP